MLIINTNEFLQRGRVLKGFNALNISKLKMTPSEFSSLSVIFYMPYRPLRAYGGYTCLC